MPGADALAVDRAVLELAKHAGPFPVDGDDLEQHAWRVKLGTRAAALGGSSEATWDVADVVKRVEKIARTQAEREIAREEREAVEEEEWVRVAEVMRLSTTRRARAMYDGDLAAALADVASVEGAFDAGIVRRRTRMRRAVVAFLAGVAAGGVAGKWLARPDERFCAIAGAAGGLIVGTMAWVFGDVLEEAAPEIRDAVALGDDLRRGARSLVPPVSGLSAPVRPDRPRTGRSRQLTRSVA